MPEREESDQDGVREAWEKEIAKRAERVRDGTAKGRPAEEVLRELRARLW